MKPWLTALILLVAVFGTNFTSYPKVDPADATPIHVVSKQADIDITSKKVIHLFGEITRDSIRQALIEKTLTETLSGDRVVLIYSGGGSLEAGQRLIDALMSEKKSGVRIVCVAIDAAHSMAFNILSFCDIRLATRRTHMVVHKAAIEELGFRRTARNLRSEADSIDRADEPYAVQNSKMMRLSRKEYDKYADQETNWTAEMLLARGYLNGLASVTK